MQRPKRKRSSDNIVKVRQYGFCQKNYVSTMNYLPTTMNTKQRIFLERPVIFPRGVIAGVTLRNADTFPPFGFSMLKASILSQEEVQRHRHAFAEQLGVGMEHLQFQNQVHGTAVRVIEQVGEPGESDGMITATEGIVLCVSIADCGAILLYDPEHRIIAGLHSGWRGTDGNIVGKGVQILCEQFSTRPSALLAYISPCASGSQYIVRSDVADLFGDDVKHYRGAEEWTIDIRRQIQKQLLAEGVEPEHIDMAEGCSMSNDRYHSYRRDGVQSGRMIAFISLLSELEQE